MRLVDSQRRAPDYRAAVGADFVQSRPSADVPHPFANAHPRIHPRPNLLDEKRLAVVVEMMARRLVGRRVACQDMRSLAMEINPRSIDDHAVGGEVGHSI